MQINGRNTLPRKFLRPASGVRGHATPIVTVCSNSTIIIVAIWNVTKNSNNAIIWWARIYEWSTILMLLEGFMYLKDT